MKTTKLLVVVVVLQLVLLAGQWLGAPRLPFARAQTMDAGRDRIQMLEEQRTTNVKLDKIIDLLDSGTLQVKVIQPDEVKGRTTAR